MGIHIQLSTDILTNIDNYRTVRNEYNQKHKKDALKLTRTGVIRYAIEKLFATENIHPMSDKIMEEVLARRFDIPDYHSPRAFIDHLALLAQSNPNGSSKTHWGEMYILASDRSHKDVAMEVHAEIKKGLTQFAIEKS